MSGKEAADKNNKYNNDYKNTKKKLKSFKKQRDQNAH